MVTPENFILKLGTRADVQELTYYAIFDADRLSGGLSPNSEKIPFCDFFAVLSFFSSSVAPLEPRGHYSRFMAHMTWFGPRTVLCGVRTMSDIIWGKCAPKKLTQKGRE